MEVEKQVKKTTKWNKSDNEGVVENGSKNKSSDSDSEKPSDDGRK
jgi:hypothetical protein